MRDYIPTQLRQFQAAYGTVVPKEEEEPSKSEPYLMFSESKLTERIQNLQPVKSL